MTLLELITKASASSEATNTLTDYPVVLNPDSIFSKLHPKDEEKSDASTLPIPVAGWKISESDSELVDLVKKFFTKLEGKLKSPEKIGKDEFLDILKSFLKSIKKKFDITIGVESSNDGYARALVEKLGHLMGKDVAALILDASVGFGVWELVETLIVNRFIRNSCYSDLVPKLVKKERSDLLCLCVKHASDLRSSELLLILQHFLGVPRNGSAGAAAENVRKEWEKQASLAIEKATDKVITGKKLKEAREAAILLAVAHDGFSSLELCLHYLLASENLDEVVFSLAVGNLSVKEMTRLIRYLKKWLSKYEKFPQAVPCPIKASVSLGLSVCDWVPKIEDVAKCLSVVLDQNYSALVLHPEFHEELVALETMVGSLASEARLCCSVANVAEKLRIEVQQG